MYMHSFRLIICVKQRIFATNPITIMDGCEQTQWNNSRNTGSCSSYFSHYFVPIVEIFL